MYKVSKVFVILSTEFFFSFFSKLTLDKLSINLLENKFYVKAIFMFFHVEYIIKINVLTFNETILLVYAEYKLITILSSKTTTHGFL